MLEYHHFKIFADVINFITTDENKTHYAYTAIRQLVEDAETDLQIFNDEFSEQAALNQMRIDEFIESEIEFEEWQRFIEEDED